MALVPPLTSPIHPPERPTVKIVRKLQGPKKNKNNGISIAINFTNTPTRKTYHEERPVQESKKKQTRH